MEEANTYPVVKENCFYDGFYILFTAPRTGKVLATGSMQYFDLKGHKSDLWAESYFKATDIDPKSFDQS